jgi:hypothetical protein
VDPDLIHRALGELETETQDDLLRRSGGDERFAVWLHLADGHRETFRSFAPQMDRADWRGLYESGRSPCEAAIVAAEPSAVGGRVGEREVPDVARGAGAVTRPVDDQRFTFGLIHDVAGVLREHGYPIPAGGGYDVGSAYREIGAALWKLLYQDTDLGTIPPGPTTTREFVPSPSSPDEDLSARARGVEL